MAESNFQDTLKRCRILVTPTSFGKENPSLKTRLEMSVGEVVYNPTTRPLKAFELLPLIRDIDGYIAGLDEIDHSVIQAGNRLRVIARYGVGVDRVDLPAAMQRGIKITNTPGANSVAVAELTIGLMLTLARQICSARQATRNGEWLRYNGIGLNGKTIGLIGLGAIGKEVALRLSKFGCRILATDPKRQQSDADQFNVQLVTLEELLPQADIISLHAPVLPETTHLVNREFLRRIKKAAMLINTARGELIDESALLDALKNGQLQGAALDCMSTEPPDPGNPLLYLPQVIVTPHIGSHTDDATNQMGEMAMADCLAILSGKKPAHPVN